MRLPIKHLSARVPWHDNKWDGSVCKTPEDNSFCRVLPNIDLSKDTKQECRYCNQRFEDIQFQPPCIGEKGGFLSPTESRRTLIHKYKQNGNSNFQEFRDITFTHKPFSINAVPFRWMLKDNKSNESEMAQRYDIEYDTDKEEKVNNMLGFRPNWVQHRDNQLSLLDSFFSCLEPNKSLVFFYAKHTPLSETNQKVLIGAAYIKHIGEIMDFEYPPNYKGHKAYVWDRLIYHSLSKSGEGCILPYHEIVDYEAKNPDDSQNCRLCVAYAPNHEQFSHASELVENDVAIDALFELQAAFRKAGQLLKQDYDEQLNWINKAIARVWEMRGAFPSMGNILTAKGIERGNSIAWRIEQYIIDTYGDIYKDDPWEIFDKCVNGTLVISGLQISSTVKTQWKSAFTDDDKIKMRLLSRIQMNDHQAKKAVEADFKIENPYELYELLRRDIAGVPFTAIDKACYPVKIIAERFPIKESPEFDNRLDVRRIRAGVIFVLEYFANAGSTLVTQSDLLKFIDEAALSTPMPITGALLENYCKDEFFSAEIIRKTNEQDETVFYKLVLLEKVRKKIMQILRPEILEKRQHKCQETIEDYRRYLNKQISAPENASDAYDLQSRQEKINAMDILARYRFSVLVGPAGSGKTTLLKALCNIPNIKNRGVVLLAPTGKARVNMAHSAQTIAQFLYANNRYDIFSGKYYMNPNSPRIPCGTLIIDEASMLTEEQLAAVLDAIIAERVILVGDNKQLPPIGAGRPFSDIVERFKPADGELTATAYAEISNISRQHSNNGKERLDVKLSKLYGSPQRGDYDDIQSLISDIMNGQNENIEFIRWDSGEELQTKLLKAIADNLELREDDLAGSFEDIALGRKDGKFFNYNYSEKVIDRWQIMSPVNGYAYGVKELNKVVQSKYRQETMKMAQQRRPPIPAPLGRDNFIYGDKVINLGNRSLKKNKAYGDTGEALGYMANGEIGIVVGQWKAKSQTMKPYVWISFSSQRGYAYSFKQNQFGESERDFDFELAYCISVHKSQGSGFDKTFLILPANNPILSKELLYTALTRQERKVVILHQGDPLGIIKYASDEYSETKRRLTDLFGLPSITYLKNKPCDSRYVNVSQRGEPVISKSEAIIANILYTYEKQGELTYVYEDKFEVDDRELKPDFIIEHIATGRKFIWEHLGRMDTDDYREKWAMKRKAYLAKGVVPAESATIDDDTVLITSEDAPGGGLDSRDIDKKINEYILLD